MCQIIASAVRTRWISFAPLGLLIPIDSPGAALAPGYFLFCPSGAGAPRKPDGLQSDFAPEARETVAPGKRSAARGSRGNRSTAPAGRQKNLTLS